MRILVLAGGNSGEKKVSVQSGVLIAKALQKNGHEVCLCDPFLKSDGREKALLQKRKKSVFQGVELSVPNPRKRRAKYLQNDFLELAKQADFVFLAFHGGMGEDGRIQALLECYGIPFTGSGSKGSMIGMDKDLTKRLLREANIPTPEWKVLEEKSADSWQSFPCVVKPNDGGSSLGVGFLNTREELVEFLKKKKKGEKWLVEKKIEGREFSIGILAGRVLPAVEIRPKSRFYDYDNKYNGTTEEICPANLSEKERMILEESAKNVFSALLLQGYARIDYLLDSEGTFWCLEANTLPGMTEESLLPKEAKAQGMDYAELCEKILQQAKKNMGKS